MKELAFVPYLTLVAAMLSAPAEDEMKAFPLAGKGMVRHVLQLPKEKARQG
jgi:serine protease inhibitor ecotin